MSSRSLAPAGRAFAFFGCMGAVVATLTFGAGLQGAADQSSATIAAIKQQHHIPTDAQFASANPQQKVVGSTKRAIETSSREARLIDPAQGVLR